MEQKTTKKRIKLERVDEMPKIKSKLKEKFREFNHNHTEIKELEKEEEASLFVTDSPETNIGYRKCFLATLPEQYKNNESSLFDLGLPNNNNNNNTPQEEKKDIKQGYIPNQVFLEIERKQKDPNALGGDIDGTITLISSDPNAESYFGQFQTLKNNKKFAEQILKPKVWKNWLHFISKDSQLGRNEQKPFSKLQKFILQFIAGYTDFFYSLRDWDNAQEIREAIILHLINHVSTKTDDIKAGNAAFNQLRKEHKSFDTIEKKDQGFARPSVLVVLPFKHSALMFISNLILLTKKLFREVGNLKRFQEEYTFGDDVWYTNRAVEFNYLFEGNIDDSFKFGLSFMGRTLKLHTQFYKSDILVCSPVALTMMWNSRYEPENDFDFLSSIEIVYVDQLDVFQMQNFEHLKDIFDHLNKFPKKTRETDFSRVRDSFLDGNSGFYRQNIFVSSTLSPDMNALFNRKCQNFRGKVKVKSDNTIGSISLVTKKLKQIWTRLEADSLDQLYEARFSYFQENILPDLLDSQRKHVIIFIPNWHEYARIEEHFRDLVLSYSKAHEYLLGSKKGDNLHGELKAFRKGDNDILLMTERFYWSTRHKWKKVEMVIFYGLPRFPQFYPELLNSVSVQSGDNRVLFSRIERTALDPIVGADRADEMLDSQKRTFLFY